MARYWSAGSHSAILLVEQRLGVLQIRGVEALGEPVVDFGEHRARFVGAQPAERHRGPQFEQSSALCSAESESTLQACLSLVPIAPELNQKRALDAMKLGFVPAVSN